MQNESTIPISISMPPDLARRVRVFAAQQDKSRSQFVREVLEKAISPGVDLRAGQGQQLQAQGAAL